MYSTYRLKTEDLNTDFLESLKLLFKNKTIEIAVCEADEAEIDETAYLLQNPANRKRLLEAIENVAQERNMVTIDLDALK
jgi:antitoxin YefM